MLCYGVLYDTVLCYDATAASCTHACPHHGQVTLLAIAGEDLLYSSRLNVNDPIVCLMLSVSAVEASVSSDPNGCASSHSAVAWTAFSECWDASTEQIRRILTLLAP